MYFKDSAWKLPVVLAFVAGSLVGCASAPQKAPPPSFDALMSQAETSVASNGVDEAIRGFESAAAADPTRKEPWVRMAQLQFDKGSYARAIVAAEEVLQRDQDDLIADGVMTVAGFRIANQSLERLKGRGALASQTAKKEAETLASTLRATMGDAILEPEKAKPRARRPAARRTPADVATPAAPEKAPAPKPTSSSDPFKNLGGN